MKVTRNLGFAKKILEKGGRQSIVRCVMFDDIL
jgi:hypothetical protein